MASIAPATDLARFQLRPLPKRFCNFERLERMMDALKLDGIVSSFAPNVFYLTGFFGTLANHDVNSSGVAIIPRVAPERAIVIVPEGMIAHFATRPTWVEDIRTFAGSTDRGVTFDPGSIHRLIPQPLMDAGIGQNLIETYTETKERAISRALRDLGIQNGRVGFDNMFAGEPLKDAETVNVYNALTWVRMVKTDAEIDLLRTATELNQLATEQTVAAWQPGMTWRQLNLEYGHRVLDLGGISENPAPNVQFNADADDPLAAKPIPLLWTTGVEQDYVLREGANIMFDCHGRWNRYCWDGGKTWIINDEPRGETKRIADACGAATDEMVGAMRPGIRISQLQALGRTVFAKHGLRPELPLIFFHGLGLEHNDLGSAPGTERLMQNRVDWALEKGMAMASHVAYPGELRERYYIEDVVVVTERGGSSFFDWGVGPILSPS